VTEHLYGGTRGVKAAPHHIHDDDGTVEGCPGCFPPGAPARRADVHDHEEFRDGTVAGCPACRLSPQELPPGGFMTAPDEKAWILDIIERFDAHLDDAAPQAYRTSPAASAELNEARALANKWRRIAGGPGCEVHEATEELLAVTGGNPRKGFHGSEKDMLGELGDTAVAALLAIQSQVKDVRRTWDVFLTALAKAESRIPAAGPKQPLPQLAWQHPEEFEDGVAAGKYETGPAPDPAPAGTPGGMTAAEWSYLADALMVFMHKIEEQPDQFAELEGLLQRLTGMDNQVPAPEPPADHAGTCWPGCEHEPEGREIALSDPELA
jgi:hypothetical protein